MDYYYFYILDHHCPYVGNCIGEKNIGKFFVFLLSIFFLSSLCGISTILKFIDQRSKKSTWNYQDIICIIIAFYSSVFFLTALIMCLMQLIFISKGITTNECMRNKYKASLYSEGCLKNWKNAF